MAIRAIRSCVQHCGWILDRLPMIKMERAATIQGDSTDSEVINEA